MSKEERHSYSCNKKEGKGKESSVVNGVVKKRYTSGPCEKVHFHFVMKRIGL